MTLPEFRKEKTGLELSEEKLLTERDALKMKLNVQHDVSAKIDLFKETCHKFLSKINDPKIVTERVKKDIIKLVIDRVVIEGESVKIFAMIPLPTKIHERELVKADLLSSFNAGATLDPINETNMARIWNKHRQTNTPLKKKVFVMMSGGVDSSVAAFLLRKEGIYEVVGVFIKGYNVDGCQDRESEDARRVAEHLDIPFYVIDLEEEYKRFVVEYLVDGYRKGITPNPDVMCNKEIKFGSFLKKAVELGADLVATGHYVRLLTQEADGRTTYALQQGVDGNKDQSYFLWTLTQNQLDHCLFPVGVYTKPEIRKIAAQAGLPTAQKKDSQGICFLGNISLRDFLGQYLPKKIGDIISNDGVKVGEHDGAWFYTIGQRHGLGIGGGPAYFVIKKDVVDNVVTVSHDDRLAEQAYGGVGLTDVNLMGTYSLHTPKVLQVMVRIRYRQPLFSAKLIVDQNVDGNSYQLAFDEPQYFVALGQSAVFYDTLGMVIGGGVMCSF